MKKYLNNQSYLFFKGNPCSTFFIHMHVFQMKVSKIKITKKRPTL